jgi:hypothetical protein
MDDENGSNEMPNLDRVNKPEFEDNEFDKQDQGLNHEELSGSNAFDMDLKPQDSATGQTEGYTGSYEGGNVAAMYKQFNGQMTAIIEAAFVLILLVLIYYLYNGKVVSYNMKVAACVVGGVYFLNEFLVYQGKSGGVVGMMGNVMGRV